MLNKFRVKETPADSHSNAFTSKKTWRNSSVFFVTVNFAAELSKNPIVHQKLKCMLVSD